MGTRSAVNKYICKCISGKSDKVDYVFDMGYVQRILIKDVFPFGSDFD